MIFGSHTTRIETAIVTLAIVATAAGTLLADWIKTTESVPLDRLLKNVTAFVEENPEDPQGHYVLGRLHSLAFAKSTDSWEVVPPKKPEEGRKPGLPGFAHYDPVRVKPNRTDFDDESLGHLRKSIIHYGRSVELDPKKGLAFLGLGWIIEVGSRFAPKIGAFPGKEVKKEDLSEEERERFEKLVTSLGSEDFDTRENASKDLAVSIDRAMPFLLEARGDDDPEVRIRVDRLIVESWVSEALDAYRKAFELTNEADQKIEVLTLGTNSAVSLEAGEGIMRILEPRIATEEDRKELDLVKEAVAKINAKPKMVTPIVFSFGAEKSLDELLAPDKTVRFDLDGTGSGAEWPWVNPGTGILVWDPEGTGRIDSGRRLFGSATWWMFWPDGYAALKALDDDRDGWLKGPELAGIAVWRDADGDGISGEGEVVPVGSAGVDAIAVTPAGRSGGVLTRPDGVRYKDGRSAPSFDWTPRSVHRREK